jgi:hypothetical protein
LLAELAFVFAPVGRMFAFDTIIRKKINRSVIPSENVLYIFMPQLAIVLFFADAATWKLFTLRDSLSLKWALSDNICNHIIERYLLIDKNIPNYLIPLFQHPWAYKTLALGNIFFQLAPLALVIFVQKPMLRILAGLCFVIEEFGLATVMHLFDYQWLILFLLFVDWDYFIQSRTKQKIIHIPFYQFVYFVLYISFFGICGLAIPYFIWNLKPNPEFNSYPFSAVSIYSSFIGTHSIGTYKCVKIGVSVPDVKESVAVSALLASQFGSIRGATDTALLRKSFSAIPILLKNQNLDTNVRVKIYDEVVEYLKSPYPPRIKSIIKSLKAEYKNGRLYFVPSSADFKEHYLVFHHQKKMNIYLFNEVLRTVFKIQPRMDSITLNHPYLYGEKVHVLNS